MKVKFFFFKSKKIGIKCYLAFQLSNFFNTKGAFFKINESLIMRIKIIFKFLDLDYIEREKKCK